MRIAAMALVLCALASPARAQPQSLPHGGFEIPEEDEPPYVDLVTIGVGERIFEKFGHAAICLRYHDAERHVPICFNFGVTDFDRGASLVWDFLRGEQDFWVEPSTWGAMFAFYTGEDRDIFVQTLPLTIAQARTLEQRLWHSIDGPEGHYIYDHFFNNCTTRLRDLLNDITGGTLVEGADKPYPLTFRELGRRGLAGLPALIVLADFVLGHQLEDTPTHWQAMFHPDILRAEIDRRFGVAPKQVYARKGEPFPVDGPTGRWPASAIGLVFALPVIAARLARQLRRAPAAPAERRRRQLARGAFALTGGVFAGLLIYVLSQVMPVLSSTFGALAFAAPGLALLAFALAGLLPRRGELAAVIWATLHLATWGFVIWALVILSPIEGVRWNEVALVAWPLDLALPLLGRLRPLYARVRLAGLAVVAVLCLVGVLRQPLWVPIFVIAAPHAALAFALPRRWRA